MRIAPAMEGADMNCVWACSAEVSCGVGCGCDYHFASFFDGGVCRKESPDGGFAGLCEWR